MYRTDEQIASILKRLQESPELDLNHPFTVSYRVPVIDGFSPSWHFVAALSLPSTGPQWMTDLVEPDESEAQLLGKYIQYILSQWYSPIQKENLGKGLPVDLGPGFNTIIFGKKENTWVYRCSSWTQGVFVFPSFDSDIVYPKLVDLLDKIESMSGTIHPSWIEFKNENNIS